MGGLGRPYPNSVDSQATIQTGRGDSVAPRPGEAATPSASVVTPPLTQTANEVPFPGAVKYGDYLAPTGTAKPLGLQRQSFSPGFVPHLHGRG